MQEMGYECNGWKQVVRAVFVKKCLEEMSRALVAIAKVKVSRDCHEQCCIEVGRHGSY